MTDEGEFLIWLVIPATKLTSYPSKSSYICIERILNNNIIYYSKHAIIQSSDYKAKPEACNLKKKNIK
eukprot:15364720-Ditylum_brightwellii.AAC.1